eukprot:m.6614 g.6614  ORF g.6614 m.6614 type:complete len:511 (+) comp16399_c0_seq2:65-1597(+)
MEKLLKELRDLVCDSEVFCLALANAKILPPNHENTRANLYDRLAAAERKICTALTQKQRRAFFQNSGGDPEKDGDTNDRKQSVTPKHNGKGPKESYVNMESDAPLSSPGYVEMSPPPAGSEESVDSLELLEEDEEDGDGAPIVATATSVSEEKTAEKKKVKKGRKSERKEKEKEKKKRKKQKEKEKKTSDAKSPKSGRLDDRDELELLEEDEENDVATMRVNKETSEGTAGDGENDATKGRRLSVLNTLRSWKASLSRKSSLGRKSSDDDAIDGRESAASPKGKLHPEKAKVAMQTIRNPAISGYLLKRDRKGRWQRRWCLVKSDRFLYSDKETDVQASNYFSLGRYQVSSFPLLHKMTHVMEFTNEKYVPYHFAASSEEELDEWMAAVKKTLRAYSNAYEVPVEFDPAELAKIQSESPVVEQRQQSAMPPALPGEKSVLCRAIQMFEGGETDELPFQVGDLILVDFCDNENWWAGTLADDNGSPLGKRGLIPKDYVSIVESDLEDDAFQ